jgi:hypothetical protein
MLRSEFVLAKTGMHARSRNRARRLAPSFAPFEKGGRSPRLRHAMARKRRLPHRGWLHIITSLWRTINSATRIPAAEGAPP